MAQIRTGIQAVDPRHALDVGRLEAYVRTRLDDFDGSLHVRQFVGGQSIPTYHLSDGRREWVLRRKPPGKLVSSAHAVDREFRVLSALSKVDFLVPRPRFHCVDESVIGTEFYVMDKIDGRILIDQTLPGWMWKRVKGYAVGCGWSMVARLLLAGLMMVIWGVWVWVGRG